ncbi:rhomboid-like protein [Amycolatopsis nigrescens]|uniref:rhomboid-like protein n=1 Tax=Amycolatopsis nigrescens TaxID=381445 RepID=UPI00036C8CB4|nr:rhomboid family intramembrane serine protease [Amycolatopsis nigrescens]
MRHGDPRPAPDGRVPRLVRLLPRPSNTPFTFWYLAVLLATTAVLHLVPRQVTDRLLALSSTDAHNLAQRPLLSLLTSALWLEDAKWIPYLVIFALTIAPLERRIGPWWTATIFVSGHLLATLATELPVLWAINAQLLSPQDSHWLDIGVSYGFFATCGALLPTLRRPWRTWTVLLVEGLIVLVYLTDGPGTLPGVVTFAGHLIALHLGMFAWRPWLRRRNLLDLVPSPSPQLDHRTSS